VNSLKINSRLMVFAVLVLLALGLAPQHTLAQTVSVSPSYLSFGIPTGTLPANAPASVPQAVYVTITSGSVTFPPTSASVSPSSPFAVTSNSCTGTLTAPAQCQVNVTLTTTSTTLLTDTLTISYGGESPLTVPLSGAYGAIKLFDETTIAVSNPTASSSSPTTIESANLNLSCPTSPITATLSNTPGIFPNPTAPNTLGDVLVDNYIILSVGGNLVSGGNSPPGNVCAGGANDGSGVPDCFSNQYRSAVLGIVGDPTDTVTNPGNSVPQMLGLAGGVAPIDVSSYLTSGLSPVDAVQASFDLLDYGGYVASSSLFLVTNCSPTGIAPGGTITGAPITPDLPENVVFDNNPNQNISATTTNTAAGEVPMVTNIGVPQSLFYQLVAGKSAAPSVCSRMTGELDSFGLPLCKAFLIQCYNSANGTTTGDNCIPTASSARTLLIAAQFSSPDEPSGVNYLYGPVGGSDACTEVVALGGGCAQGTGPALLMGGDSWLCTAAGAPVALPCTPVEANTESSGTIYSPENCVLTGALTNFLCPLDTLSEFKGAADALHGGGTTGTNSIVIPVVNMPLPFTNLTTSPTINPNGWVNSLTLGVSLTANQATYSNPPTCPTTPGTIPCANGFTPAPPYSVTYGISPIATPLPDTLYPVPTDSVQYAGNSTVFHNTDPLQPPPTIANCTTSLKPSFVANDSFMESEGIYNLHYFTTDCAFTEGLVFNPTAAQQSDPTANWASFQVTSVGLDNVAPTLTCAVTTPIGNNGWYTTPSVNASCTANDDFSGFGIGSAEQSVVTVPGTNPPVLQGPTRTSIGPVSTVVNSNPALSAIPAQSVTDLAGNPSNTQGPYQTPIDSTPPTIGVTYSAGQTLTVGQTGASITYTCKDTGSGIATCPAATPVPTACPAAPSVGLSSFSSNYPISTSSAGTYSSTVNSTDCAGNQSAPANVSYTVSYAPADVGMLALPITDNIAEGSTGKYYAGVIDWSSATAYNVVITTVFTVPVNVLNGSPSAGYKTDSCSTSSCSIPTSWTSCSTAVVNTVNSTTTATISCNVGVLPSISTKTGVVLMVNIPVLSTAKVNTKFTSVTTVSSANDPKPSNNSVPENYNVIK
jgi:hypothetical protein